MASSSASAESSSSQPSSLWDDDKVEAARAFALRKLTGAPQTRHQLRQAMLRRQISEDVLDPVLDRLEAAGLIDDAAFATAWVESRHRTRGLARSALTQELRQRGVDKELIDAAVADLEPDDEFAMAVQLATKRQRSLSGLDYATQARRLTSLLARKGYGGGLSSRVVRQVLESASLSGSP